MANSIEKTIVRIIQRVVRNDYPHIECPAGLCASIVDCKEMGEFYEYTIRILDIEKQTDSKFSDIPKIRCKQGFELGQMVAVIFLYGKEPYIIGRAD